MEAPDQRPPQLLSDLALIYLTLAHGTDKELDDAEVDKIADLLHSWQAESQKESVLGAIKSALASYERDDALDLVNQAIRDVREHASPEQRQFVMDDLVEIALADGRFLHEESTFIGRLAEAWDVEVTGGPEGWAGSAWSVLQEKGPRESWTALHDLAFIYLSLAYETDSELSRDEVEVVTKKVSEWVPGATESDVLALVREVLETYVQGPNKRAFADAVVAVGDAVPAHQHEALLEDLRSVALADGQLLDTEREMIERLVEAWNIDSETYSSES